MKQHIAKFFRTRWGQALILLTALFTLACLCVIFTGLRDDLQPADVAVVLGNKVNPNGTPSPMLKARLDHAVKLYQEGYCKLILVSGGFGKEGYSEPAVMHKYLENMSIPSDLIFEDPQGNNTWATAKNTANFLQQHQLKSAIIVSQYYHIARCRLAFGKFGITPIYSSHANYYSPKDLYSIPREVFAFVSYFFRSPDTALSQTEE